MTTSYTSKLKLALPTTGELDGTWGDVVNNNITSMVEEAIAGLAAVSTWAGASHTLTTADGTTSEARCMMLVLSGAPGAAGTVITPATSKVYLVTNSVTGGYAVTVKVSGQTGISVPNGSTMWLYCNGTDIVSGINYAPSMTLGTPLPVASGGSGVATITGIVKGNGTSAMSAATANTDYLAPAMGNTAISGIKTAVFNGTITNATTTGAVTIDWTAGSFQKQNEPTGTITYTFTAPPGICHLQLLIDSDGTSSAQTITWPGSVIWLGATWTATANKKAIINFFYDGTNYYASGMNQV